MTPQSVVAFLLCASVPVKTQTPAPARPVLIRGAIVVDGSGGPSRVADVRIAGSAIQQVGQLTASSRDSVVEARGLVLAPGFIDTHSHHDRGLDSERTALAAVSQGITTIVVGQDGWSRFPLADWFAGFERRPAAVNVASYVGHGRLRDVILSDDFKRQATPAEVRHMSAVLDGEMAAGALGLSSGLEYDPGIYSSTEELVALARVALPAANVGITNRGRIAPGLFADLVLVDTTALADRATPQNPHLKATGVRAVWVNGSLVYNGSTTGAFPGRVIRRR